MTPSSSKKTAPKIPPRVEQIGATFALAVLTAFVLKTTVYLRPGPFGTPFSLENWSDMFAAVFFEGYGLALLTLPFLGFAFFRKQASGFALRTNAGIHTALCFISLLVTHADHETQRFMGIHLSLNYLKTYARIENTPVAIGHAISDDLGGSYSAYYLLAIPVLFLIAKALLRRKLSLGPLKKRPYLAVGIAAALFILAPAIALLAAPSDSPYIKRLRSPILLVSHETETLLLDEKRPDQIHESIELFQARWKQGDTNSKWRFDNPDYPLRKSHVGPCDSNQQRPWNFIVLQLETFRSKDMKLFNPSLETTSTPFIDDLGRDEKSAHWTRFFGNGLPTVYSFMAIQTGLFPHSKECVAIAFEDTELEGMTGFLRKGGYNTSFFSGPDPDWDNESYWLNKWYDYVVFRSEYNEEDRPLFREAAGYLKERGDDGPFFTMIASISNHIPFRSPQPALDITNSKTIIDRLRNTMHYTDDVVREFVDAIKDEPWFDRTILIITGDHGFDLGDRGAMIGHSNLRHETTWVPLIIHGNHPALPHGPQIAVGSHVDLAPTIVELAGRCDDNSFMGHSLLNADPSTSWAAAVRDKNTMIETNEFSAYFPLGAEPMLFSPKDMPQTDDISAEHKHILNKYSSELDALLEITDWVYERDRVVPK